MSSTMNRRQALGAMIAALGLGATGRVFGAEAFLAGVSGGTLALDHGQRRLLERVADTIIPATKDVPGAAGAGVGVFMEEAVRDYYTEEQRQTFLQGLPALDALAEQAYKRSFLALEREQCESVLLALEAGPSPRWYDMMKQLTVWGYFASEVGATQARRHIAIPGRYQGVVEIPEGTRAWAI